MTSERSRENRWSRAMRGSKLDQRQRDGGTYVDWNLIFYQVLAQVGTATAIAAALGVLGKLAVDHFFKAEIEAPKADLKQKNDRELALVKHNFESALLREKANADKGLFLFQHGVETEAAGAERVRRELSAWASPILSVVEDLMARLGNILDKQGYEGLDPRTATLNPNWSMNSGYFMTSTLYQFGKYFCWIGMLEEELSFEVFRSHKEMDEFLGNLIAVSKALGDYPPVPPLAGTGNDTQVFRLQQRAIGEALAIREGKRRACLGYNLFVTRRADAADKQLRPFLVPLEKLIDCVKPGDVRFARLVTVRSALEPLKENCRRLLVIPQA